MDGLIQVVAAVVAGIGGIGAIFVAVVKFSSNIIAKRLEQRYSLKMNKELEQYKSQLDSKTYISKTKFDTEFAIYRDLSKAFFEMVRDVSIMIPIGVASYPADEKAKREYEEKLYKSAVKSCVAAQDALSANIPFISESLCDKYEELSKLCKIQLKVFERRWDVYCMASQEEKETFSGEDYRRTEEINEKYRKLNNDVRKYLDGLDVLE